MAKGWAASISIATSILGFTVFSTALANVLKFNNDALTGSYVRGCLIEPVVLIVVVGLGMSTLALSDISNSRPRKRFLVAASILNLISMVGLVSLWFITH